MEESQELEKLPRVVTGVLKIVLSTALIALAAVLIIALVKVIYLLAMMVLNTSSVVSYDVAEQAEQYGQCSVLPSREFSPSSASEGPVHNRRQKIHPHGQARKRLNFIGSL